MHDTRTHSVADVKQILEDADVESFYGIAWHADRGEYLQTQDSAGWDEGMAGVSLDEQGRVWIDPDAVGEAARDRRVEALRESGYSGELASSQRGGYDEDAARALLAPVPVNLTECRFPSEHNPNHGTNYRFHVYNPRDPASDWQHLTEAEMVEKGDPTYGWLVSSQYHSWDTP